MEKNLGDSNHTCFCVNAYMYYIQQLGGLSACVYALI